MTRYFILISLLIAQTRFAAAQEWKASAIPELLTKNAGMVKREDLTEIDILSPKKARLHIRYVYTVLGPIGDKYNSIITFYDRFHNLASASGALYSSDGQVLKKFKKSDMEDVDVGGGIFMTDSKAK